MSVPDFLPPSPPTTSSRKPRMPLFQIPPTSTPDDSPASEPPSSLGSRKKVGFSLSTDIHESTDVINITDKILVRPLPPSRDCSKSGKSILKANGQGPALFTPSDGPGDEKQPLSETMDSLLQQLARNDTVECVDAYQTLASAIKAYDELPEQIILRSKLQSITKFIKLHLAALDQPDPQPCDVNLVTSALKVLVILVWNPDFAPYLNDEFRLFVLDRAISVVAEHKAPKSVIVHYLHLLATQDFRQGLLTSTRASRLLDALALLTDHVKGNGVVSERVLVYHKLIDQARPVMKIKAGLWVEHMLSAMISSIPDTRSKALALGRKACKFFPASDSIASTVKSVLDDVQDDNKTKGYSMCKKLERMVAAKDSAEHVPQTWAVVILLCSSESVRIDSWSGLKEWLMVIQRCFNSSDSGLRSQANLAWNRFVHVARPQEASNGLMAMLAKPIVAQLERQTADKSSKASHSAAVSSYCNLLYYAFRPATSPARLTKAWNEYIVKVMRSSFFEKHPANADMACRILMTLLWNTKTGTKVWNEKRAHENRAVEPDELPTIDSKWVRGHTTNIINIFDLLFRYSSWGFPESSEQAYISKAWRHFIKSIRSASSKEIKMTNETRAAVLAIMDSVTALSSTHAQSNGLPSNVLSTITATAVVELGASHILEAFDVEHYEPSATALTAILDQIRLKMHSTGSPMKQQVDTLAKFVEVLDRTLAQSYKREQIEATEIEGLMTVASQTLTTLRSTKLDNTLCKLEAGFSLWLRDERDLLTMPALGRLAEGFARAATSVQSESVQLLDSLFAAAFNSTHGTIVSSIVTAWNNTLGDCEDLELGPQLHEAVKRLGSNFELRLPAQYANDPSTVAPEIPAYNTQYGVADDVAAGRTEVEPNPRHETDLEATDAPVTQTSRSTKAVREKKKLLSGKRRLRHDDSQVDFVAVDSSPIGTGQESQLLTEHQKEVRDKQRGEPAVVFPDLRSSPRPASRSTSESRDCGLARKAANMTERPSTPVPDPGDDADVQPSPTPKSRYVRDLAEVEIPSSPPSLQGAQEKLSDALLRNPSTLINEEALEVEDVEVDLVDEEGQEKVDNASQDAEQEGLPEKSNNVTFRQDESRERDTEQIKQLADTHIESHDVANSADEAKQAEEQIAPRNDVAEVPLAQNTEAHDIDSVTAPSPRSEQPASPKQRPDVVYIASQPAPQPSTPPRVSSRIDSDELEWMSASQLERDLDWSAILDGLDHTPLGSVGSASKPVVEVPAIPVPTQRKAPSRKRKAAGAGWTRNKKTKKSSHAGSQSTESQESFIKYEEEELEVQDDIIEVITSSDPPAPSSPPRDSEHDVFVDAPESQVEPPKKKRGRPRKQPRPEEEPFPDVERGHSRSSGSQSSRRSLYSVEPSPEPEVEEHSVQDVDMEDEASILEEADQHHEEVIAQESSVEEELLQEELQAPASAPTPEPAIPIVESQAAQPPADILASLQQVLDRMKHAEPGSVDMKAVDELCFQIRFQAQVKSMQGA